jgi:hypothetical protein
MAMEKLDRQAFHETLRSAVTSCELLVTGEGDNPDPIFLITNHEPLASRLSPLASRLQI